MENNLPNKAIGLLDKANQLVEEFNFSDNLKYSEKMFNEKLSKLEKEINTLLPELKLKEINLFNHIISSSFELGVVSASYTLKCLNTPQQKPTTKNNLLVERNTSSININENPLTG